MHNDRIVIGNLSLVLEMIAMDASPCVAAVGATQNSEQKVLLAACFVLRKRVKHVRFRLTNRQAGASEQCGVRKASRQVLPFFSTIERSPNAAARALFRERGEDCSFFLWMKYDCVAPV